MKTTILAFLITLTTSAQHLGVTYTEEINTLAKISSTRQDYLLHLNNNKSKYIPIDNSYENRFFNAADISEVWNNKKEGIIALKLSDKNQEYAYDKIIYKDLNGGKLYANRALFTTMSYIDDSDIQLEWDIITSEKVKEIAGYYCQKAITKFRGRVYEAYYTTDVPIPNGPYKFQGLPGLILEVSSTDGYYKATAIEVNKLKEDSQIIIENPFAAKKLIAIDEYKRILVEKLIKSFKASKSVDADEGSISVSFEDQLEDLGIGLITVD
jgi:GLPGLI family protein